MHYLCSCNVFYMCVSGVYRGTKEGRLVETSPRSVQNFAEFPKIVVTAYRERTGVYVCEPASTSAPLWSRICSSDRALHTESFWTLHMRMSTSCRMGLAFRFHAAFWRLLAAASACCRPYFGCMLQGVSSRVPRVGFRAFRAF